MNTLRIFFCGVILLCTATATDAATRGGTDVCGTSDLIFADAFEFELIFQDNFELDFCIVAMDTLGAAAEQAFAHQVRTIPSEAQVVSYSITKGPPGLSIDANGLLHWNPTLANLGLHSINIRAVDQTGFIDTEAFWIDVFALNSPPLLADVGQRTAVVAHPFSIILQAEDADDPETLAFSLTQAPPGMSIDPITGSISWTPGLADIGGHAVSATVTDSAGFTDATGFTVAVVMSNSAPVFVAVADQGAILNSLFMVQLQANDADGDPLTFNLDQAPAGMAINSTTGMISWTPDDLLQGNYTVTAIVSDTAGASDTTSFDILVDNNVAPIAVDDGPYLVERAESISVMAPGVLDNDSDPNQQAITATLETDVQAGTLSLNADGSFEYTPDNPVSPIGFELKYEVQSEGYNALNMPTIADLDNDGFTDIAVRHSNLGSDSSLQIIRGDTGTTTHVSARYGRDTPADFGAETLADIDLDGKAEMISIGGETGRSTSQTGRKLIAVEHDGSFKWVSEALPDLVTIDDVPVATRPMSETEPAIADLDQDGTPEIVVGHAVRGDGHIGVTAFDNQGKIIFTGWANDVGSGTGSRFRTEIVDLDLDGDLEILVGSAAFSHRGELLWVTPNLSFSRIRTTPIAANLDNDPFPELVRETSDTSVAAYNHDGSLIWETPTQFMFTGVIPLVAADIDDDGQVEILALQDNGFSPGKLQVLDGQTGNIDWEYPSLPEHPDFNPRNLAPSVFDLDRDGNKEIILFDSDRTVHVLNGMDGSLIDTFDLGLESTSVNAMPIFADIDQDGASELILTANPAFGFGPGLIRVYESPNDDWLPTRSIFNQWNYHVTNINEDGTVPQYEQPFWLLPGLNQNRLNGLLPEERTEDTDQFSYRAFDGELTSNAATVSFTILPPNSPPRIVSEPRQLASPDFLYTYPVLAVDADVGETLSYTLLQAPAAMQVDTLGQIEWIPSMADLGDHQIILEVRDSIGKFDTQMFTLSVQPAVTVPDVVGQTQAIAEGNITAANLQTNPVFEVYDDVIPVGQVMAQHPSGGSAAAAGDDVRIDVSRGPAPVDVPRLTGLNIGDAENRLITSGLLLGTVTYENRDDLPLGTVITQTPAARTEILTGESVAVTVSGGPRLDLQVGTPLVIAGQSTTIQVTAYTNDGMIEDPQPTINLSVESDPGDTAGPSPTINGTSLDTDVASMGEYRIVADLPNTMETFTTSLVVMPAIADGPDGDIFSEFAAQLEQYDDLLLQLDDAFTLNDVPLIQSLDTALLTLRDEIIVDRMQGLSALAPEGGIPPDAETAIALGIPAGAQDDAYLAGATALQGTMAQMAALIADPLSPDTLLFNLNQDLISEATALANITPGVPGVLAAAGPTTQILNHQTPAMVRAEIWAIHQSLQDAGLLSAGAPAKMAKAAKFSLLGMMSATRIRNRVIKNVYAPLLGDLARASVVLIAENALTEYLNFGSHVGIITAASLSIHVAKIPNSVVEGYGFEAYAQANTTFVIGPDAIEQALSLLNSQLPTAKDLKDINSIKQAIKDVADIGNQAVDLVKGTIATPTALRSNCILDLTPGCGQLVYPYGFQSAYEADGPLALPAPVLIMTFGQASGNTGVFVAAFLPTDPKD